MAKKRKLTHGEGWSLEPADSETSEPAASLPPSAQTVRVRKERRPGGNTVTAVSDWTLTPADAKALAKRLKQACGAGGTVKNGIIDIQGDCTDRVAALLRDEGWTVKG